MDTEGWHNMNSSLKGIISETRMSVEKKSEKIQMVNTFGMYMMLTNHHSAVRIEKTDRRTLCLQLSNTRVGDRAYFNRLYSTMAKPEAAPAMMAWLMARDLSETCIANVPETQMKRDLCHAQRPSTERFLVDYIEDLAKPEKIWCEVLYRRYTDWCGTHGENNSQALTLDGRLTPWA